MNDIVANRSIAPDAANDPPVAPAERYFHAQDGLRLFYRDWGDPRSRAIPLLYLPGLTRNGKDFSTAARGHARTRRVLCPDYRGRGRSAYDPDWRHYEPRTYLDDLRHLLTVAGVHRAIVIGTSMGGLLGMAMAAVMPTAIAGLVINDVGPTIDASGSRRILDYISVDRPQPDWPAAVADLRRFLPTLSLRSDDEWLALARNTYRQGDDGLLHFDWDVNLVKPLQRDPSGGVPDLWPFYRAIRRMPALVVRGGVSDVLSAETLARMRAEKPDLRAVELPGVGHAPTLLEPEAREAIDDFISRL